MRKLMAGIVAGQIVALAPPAMAADLQPQQPAGASHIGTFVGARLRVPLGAARERPHAGLAFTATQRSAETGTLRLSKGMELGVAGDEKIRFSVGGRSFSQLTRNGPVPDGRKLGVSGAGWTAIGVGVVAIAVAGLYIWVVDHQCDCE